MSNRDLIDHDPMTGISCYIEWLEGTKFRIVHETSTADMQPILDNNARLRNNTQYKKDGIKKSWMHAADIPPYVQTKWLTEDGINLMDPNDWPRVRAKLNSPDYAYLKAIDGTV